MRAAEIQGVEAGDIGSALRDGIGIVLRPVIDKKITGEKSPPSIGVDTIGGFVVTQGLVEG